MILAFPLVIISVKVLGPLIFLLLAIMGIYIAISEKLSPFSMEDIRLFSWITFGYFLVMLFSVVLSNEPTNSWIHLSRKSQFLMAPFVVLAFYKVDISIKTFLNSVKVGTIIIGLIVSVQYLLGYGGGRLSGMFNPNTFGDLAVLMTLFTIVGVKEESIKEFRWSLIALFFGVVAIVMSNSRGAILSFMIVLLLYAILMHKVLPHMRKRSWIAVAVGVTTFITISLGVGITDKRVEIVQTQIEQWKIGDNLTSSVGVRLEMYQSGIKAFLDSPLVGYGYRNSTAVASRYANQDAKEAIYRYTHLHNEYLTNMVSAGIIGLLSLLILLGVPLVSSIRVLHRDSIFPFALMGVLLVVGYATLGVTHGMLEWEYENSFYIYFLAYLMPKLWR